MLTTSPLGLVAPPRESPPRLVSPSPRPPHAGLRWRSPCFCNPLRLAPPRSAAHFGGQLARQLGGAAQVNGLWQRKHVKRFLVSISLVVFWLANSASSKL
jgi:hypothetical protein